MNFITCSDKSFLPHIEHMQDVGQKNKHQLLQ